MKQMYTTFIADDVRDQNIQSVWWDTHYVRLNSSTV